MLRLTLFGPPQLTVDATPIDLHRDKALALLAYLATTGMVHRRDHLAALLWPDYSQSRARTYLRQTFYILSKALGCGWFQSDRTTIGLYPGANVQVDVQEFQVAVEAAWAATPEAPQHLARAAALALLHWGNLDLPRNLESAIDAYSQSSKYYEAAGLRWEAVIARSWLGKAHQILHHEQAIELLSEAQSGLEVFGDRRSVARVLEDIAIYYLLNQPNLEAALETAQASLELRRQNDDQLGISSSLNVMGSAYHWLGQDSAALPVLSEALTIAQRLGHRPGECRIYLDTANAYGPLGRWEEMQIMAERGLALARELGQARYTHYLLLILGKLALIRGDYEAAHDLNTKSFDVLGKAGIPIAEAWPHTSRAHSAWKVGNGEEAREHISSSLRHIVARSDTFNAVRALRLLAQAVAVQGDLERAVEIDATAGAASTWDESLTMRAVFIEPLEKLTEGLAPEFAAAARERGSARDLFETAAELLEEVQDPSWEWGACFQLN